MDRAPVGALSELQEQHCNAIELGRPEFGQKKVSVEHRRFGPVGAEAQQERATGARRRKPDRLGSARRRGRGDEDFDVVAGAGEFGRAVAYRIALQGVVDQEGLSLRGDLVDGQRPEAVDGRQGVGREAQAPGPAAVDLRAAVG